MNIKKLSALLVLMSVFVFSAAVPAFAKTDTLPHPPQCQTSQSSNKIVIECLDYGEDIVMADIIKSNQPLNYTAEWDGDTAVIEVILSLANRKPAFVWTVVDKQGNEVIGRFPTSITDG